MAHKPRVIRTCLHCKKRRSRASSGMCIPCETLTKAEGTFDKLKLPSHWDKKRAEAEQKVRAYNRLMRKGYAPKEIAALWNMEPSVLATKMWKARKKYGFKTEKGRNGANYQKAGPTSEVRPHLPRNEHGGGRWGIQGCICDLCVARRKQSRRECDEARKLKNSIKPS